MAVKLKFHGKLPTSIWALGIVSLCMDASSELVHSLLPVFMVGTLGASVTAVGSVEGIAAATAMITKTFSGMLSDYLGKRKLLTIIGYSLAAVSKPLFPLSHSIATVMAARLIDRIGKGIRGAPRDALISDITPAELRGAAYGLREALDTVGAVIGPLLAVWFMILLAGDIRMVMWVAVIPAFLAVLVLVLWVKEPKASGTKNTKPPFRVSEIRLIGGAYWRLVAVGSILTLARFSEAFLILKAQGIGIPAAQVPLVMVVMSLVYAAASYPAGALSDRISRTGILLAGIAFLIAADVVLGLANDRVMLALGVALWGLHMGFSQGLISAMIADASPDSLRGTAFGLYNLATGITMLLSSVAAGMLWDHYGPSATFFAGAACACAALTGIIALRCKAACANNSVSI
jgi:MFS family permease